MSAIALFTGNVPAHIAALQGKPSAFDKIVLPAGGGIPRISIKGNRFTILKDGEETQLNSLSLEAIVIGVREADYRTWYAGAYDPKAGEVSPACWSADDIKPSPTSPEPQAEMCATCPKNQWGSRPQGNGKACNTHRRVILLAAGDEAGDMYSLNIPGGSIAAFGKYFRTVKQRGYNLETMVTKIGFASQGVLTFDAANWLSESAFNVVKDRVMDADVVAALEVNFKPKDDEEFAPAPAPAAAPTQTKGFGKAATPAPAPTPAPDAPAVEKNVPPPKRGGFGSGETKAAAPAPAPVAAPSDLSALESDLEKLLGGAPDVA